MLFSICVHVKLFKPIFTANSVIITYGFTPFDICKTNLKLWCVIKFSYVAFLIFSRFIILDIIYKYVFSDVSHNKKTQIHSTNDSSINLFAGIDVSNNQNVYLCENGLYQNVLVTGTIGGGKTTGIMYPFTKQLMSFKNKLRYVNSRC